MDEPALVEPQFNLLGVQTTTGTAAVAVVLRGPPVAALGLNAGTNVLGPATGRTRRSGAPSRWRWRESVVRVPA